MKADIVTVSEKSETYLKKKIRKISVPERIIVFLIIGGLIYGLLNFIAQPVYTNAAGGYNYDVIHGFYEEPRNSIETVFLGSSHVRCAISPMRLYENYGICSYDFSTGSQPMAASYFWLKEAYRLHCETIDTVVLDVGMLKRDPGTAFYHRALDDMQFSAVKLQAVASYSSDLSEFLLNMIPLFSYHERWKELTDEDFLKFGYEPKTFIRGYDYLTSQWINSADVSADICTPLRIADGNAESTVLNETAVEYFAKIVSFCEEHDLNLLLIKIPTTWSASDHNAVQSLADAYGLDFIDFNVEPYYSEAGFNIASDMISTSNLNNLHSNYYGAMKITDYLGNYLVKQYGCKDVRKEEDYAFMDEELEEYNRYIADIILGEIEDPADYIAYLMEQGDYEIFISVRGEASDSLTDEQRRYFESIGLENLSSLKYNDSYLAIIDDGEVIAEELRNYDKTDDSTDNSEAAREALSVSAEGIMADGTTYSLTSCGGSAAAKASCQLNGTEYAANSRGLNFVIYDKRSRKVVDEAVFDTHSSDTRKPASVETALTEDLENGVEYASMSSNEQKLYIYNQLCDAKMAEQTAGEDGLLEYLSSFWNYSDYTIFISAKGDASAALTEEVRTYLESLDLKQLSKLEYQDSYLAVVSDGEILKEGRNHAEDSLKITGPGYSLTSGGAESGNISSIIIDGKEYSPNKQGLNIVVMSNLNGSMISTISFDTSDITPFIIESWEK